MTERPRILARPTADDWNDGYGNAAPRNVVLTDRGSPLVDANGRPIRRKVGFHPPKSPE